METCWLYPWALLAGHWFLAEDGRPLLTPVALFGLFWAARAATCWSLERGWPLRRARLALAAFFMAAAALAVRIGYFGSRSLDDLTWLASLVIDLAQVLNTVTAPLASAGLALVVCWRATRYGRGALRYEDLEGAFAVGVAGLVFSLALGMLASPADYRATQESLGLCAVGYVFAGLTSLSLARVEAARERGKSRGEPTLAINRQWLVAVLGVVFALVSVSLLLAQALSFDLIAGVLAPLFRLLSGLVWAILYLVAVPIGLVMEGLIRILRMLARPGAAEPPPQPGGTPEPWPMQVSEGKLPPEIIVILKLIVVALLVLGVALVLARAVRPWLERPSDEDVAEERESVADWKALLRLFLAWLRGRLGLLPSTTQPTQPEDIRAAEATPAYAVPVATIRELYRQLLLLGARLGAARPAYDTPYEHLPRLQASLGPHDDVAALTEVYVRTRYGPDLPAEAEVQEARAHWERVSGSAELESQGSSGGQ